MASTEIVTLTDDLDPTIEEGVQTVSFFDPETGEKVELELGEKNAKALNKAIAGLEKYLAVARVIKPEVKATKPATAKSDLSKVREWAQANGYAVGDRGRIKSEIMDAYKKAIDETLDKGKDLDAAPVVAVREDSVPVVDGFDTAPESVEITEQDDDTRPATEAELQDMLREMAVSGTEPTLDDLKVSE